MRCITPVSYTHLDVYKRQQLLSNITAQITYADGTNSRDRYAQYLEKGSAPYIDTTNLHYVTQEDLSLIHI